MNNSEVTSCLQFLQCYELPEVTLTDRADDSIFPGKVKNVKTNKKAEAGRAGHLPVRRSVVQSPAPPVYLLSVLGQDPESQIAPDCCSISV